MYTKIPVKPVTLYVLILFHYQIHMIIIPKLKHLWLINMCVSFLSINRHKRY